MKANSFNFSKSESHHWTPGYQAGPILPLCCLPVPPAAAVATCLSDSLWFSPPGSCARMKREAFSQSRCSKKLWANLKSTPKSKGKRDGSSENILSVKVFCHHSAACDHCRFTVREFCCELEDKKAQERMQLNVCKKEQYVRRGSGVFSVLPCVSVGHKHSISSTGSLRALAEGEFQRGVCRLDPLEGVEGVRGINSQVRVDAAGDLTLWSGLIYLLFI